MLVAQEKAPEGIDYGVYAPYYKAKAEVHLKSRAKSICGKLAGLNKPCPTCRQLGVVKIVLREGFHDANNVWVPPLEDVRDCPTCDRRKYLFRESVARRFIGNGLAPESRSSTLTERDLMRRLESSRSSYRTIPRLKFQVRGRYGIVSAASGDGVFPLHFFLVPTDKKFTWYLHDPVKHGSFEFHREFAKLPARTEITEVYAGDILRIGGRRIVRLAGITVPGPDGKVLKGPQYTPDEVLRAIVRKELKGKSVRLKSDPRAPYTCRGVPLVFVEVDDVDYAEQLIRRGLVRRHPKHKSQRSSQYLKAEKEAREQKAGIWGEILGDD
jgi:endonuclease YncB( thermonuclease family)